MIAPGRLGRRLGCVLAVLIAMTFVLAPAPAAAGDGVMTAAPTAPEAAGWSVLDGKVFEGEFGLVGEAAMGDDRWVFDDGMFLSEGCVDCGFPQSPYWVRFEEGTTKFVAETRCPVTDAEIVWRGTIEDGRIEGVYTWTKERWYWTVEKTFWFEGELAAAPDATAAVR